MTDGTIYSLFYFQETSPMYVGDRCTGTLNPATDEQILGAARAIEHRTGDALTEAPDVGEAYYSVDEHEGVYFVARRTWSDTANDFRALDEGRAFATREAALRARREFAEEGCDDDDENNPMLGELLRELPPHGHIIIYHDNSGHAANERGATLASWNSLGEFVEAMQALRDKS